jgi:hypothetical protein
VGVAAHYATTLDWIARPEAGRANLDEREMLVLNLGMLVLSLLYKGEVWNNLSGKTRGQVVLRTSPM